ncbi:hypothetical protein FACS1894156_1880 [Bacteroidia bacterium]|nr:hypothetical protein FACS1894156_1880 [Bacteroidia bacterium]
MEAKKVWFTDNRIYIQTEEGKHLWQSLLWYPRLLDATDEQRADYELEPFGIHWETIDEDVSYESFLYKEHEPITDLSRALKSFPEINISGIARQMDIPRSQMAAYICGAKNPSHKRKKEIETHLHTLGRRLIKVSV